MITLEKIPLGLEETLSFYGTPWKLEGTERVPDEEWQKENLTSITLPHPLRYSWKDEELFAFQCHKKIAKALKDALLEIGGWGGWEWLRKQGYDRWGGCFNPRMKRGKDEPSVHYFGAAIDLNPHLGPFGKPGVMPYFIVSAFEKRGFYTWKTDQSHFQAVRGF